MADLAVESRGRVLEYEIRGGTPPHHDWSGVAGQHPDSNNERPHSQQLSISSHEKNPKIIVAECHK